MFQSARPVKDATLTKPMLLALPGVSIRASREGRDYFRRFFYTVMPCFNPRVP